MSPAATHPSRRAFQRHLAAAVASAFIVLSGFYMPPEAAAEEASYCGTEPVSTAQAGSPEPSASPANPSVDPTSPPTGVPWQVTLRGQGYGCALQRLVSFRNGFAAVQDGTVVVSSDGFTWPSPGESLPGAVHLLPVAPFLVEFQGELYAFGVTGDRQHGWRRDADGQWQDLGLPDIDSSTGVPQQTEGVAATGGRLVVLVGVRTPRYDHGCESSGPCPDTSFIWTTTDGTTWRVDRASNAHGKMLRASSGDPMYLQMPWPTANGFSVEGLASRIYDSKDGFRWTRSGSIPPDLRLRAIGEFGTDHATYAVVDGTISDQAAVGAVGTAVVLRSTDRRHWKEIYRAPEAGWQVVGASVGSAGIAMGGIVIRGETDPEAAWMISTSDSVDWSVSEGWPAYDPGCVDEMAVGANHVVAAGGFGCALGPLAWASPGGP